MSQPLLSIADVTLDKAKKYFTSKFKNEALNDILAPQTLY